MTTQVWLSREGETVERMKKRLRVARNKKALSLTLEVLQSDQIPRQQMGTIYSAEKMMIDVQVFGL